MSSLVTPYGDLIGRDTDLGTITVTDAMVRRYAAAVGDAELAAGHPAEAPLGLAMAVRGAPTPPVTAAPGTVSVHGGHTITMRGRFAIGDTYRVRSRIVQVFEKSGRSGPLAVIARRATLCALDEQEAVAIDEQEIVRWQSPPRASTVAASAHGRSCAPATIAPASRTPLAELAVGDLIAENWCAPSTAEVAAYSSFIGASREPLFTDVELARSLGFRSVIVPGPMQSAAIEAMLRVRLAQTVLVKLSLTFRMSISPGDRLTMSAIVVEHRPCERGAAVVCDLALEHGSDQTAIGTAELHPA